MAAEGFESFHVPQQSRRDKLRVLPLNNHPSSTTTCDDETLHACPPALLSFYDPSLLHSHMLSTIPDPCKQPACINSPSSSVKEEGANNLLAYVGGSMNSSSSASQLHHHHHHHHNPFLDPHTTHPSNLNPNHQIQDINGANPFLYNLRDFDHHHQSFSEGGSADVVTYKPQALSLANNESRVTAQGLSLSLSSHHQNLSYNAMFDAKANPSPIGGGGGYAAVRGIVPCGSSGGGASTSNDVRSLVPLGPFTGYASILKGSRFLKPAQQLLEDLCDVGRGIYVERRTCGDSSLMDPSVETLTSASGMGLDESLACSTTDHRGHDHRRKKMRLISLLEEVYRRYKLYYQQMQTIVSSFESVAGLGNAAPYASFALKAMSKHFKCLKNSITDQLNFTSKALGDGNFRKNEATAYGNTDQWVHSHRTIQNPGIFEHQPVWRPQRGLPERAVAVLRAWLFEHFLHPYPTDTDKQMLAKQTGLSRSQVSNWFINARVRLWKPMVEEIHMLETRQAQKPSDEDQNSCKPNESSLPTVNSPLSDKQVQSNPQHKAEDHSIKRSRNEVPNVPNMGDEPMNFSYNNLSSHEHVGGGVSGTGGNSGVSLTLGLRQNNGIGLSDRFPMNIARRFGVDPSNEGYIVSGFEGSNRQFGKDIGGHLLHDFVG